MWNYEWLKEHKMELRWIIGAVVLLMILLLSSTANRNSYLIKKDGAVIGITRESLEEPLTMPLQIQLEQNGKKQTYDITLHLQNESVPEDGDRAAMEAKENDVIVEETISNLVRDLEGQKVQKLFLPQSLEDGTPLLWKQPKDFRVLFILLLIPACLLYIRESERQKQKEERTRFEEDIKRALPGFADQLLLMLNCGLIFHDAYTRIAQNYAKREVPGTFGRLLLDVKREEEETGVMIVTVMKERAGQIGVREYVRIVNMIMDHQHKGVNLEEKLQGESRLLWEGRKAHAMQKGKELETKMTFPLAILLLVLILVVGTPALMNM